MSTAAASAAISRTRRCPSRSSTSRAQRDQVQKQRAPDNRVRGDDEDHRVSPPPKVRRSRRASSSCTREYMKYAYTSVNAPTETRSVSSIEASSVGDPPARSTVGSWCRELAQSTDRWTMGTSTTKITPRTAARVARREKSVSSPRSRRYPTYITNMTAVVTRRGSQVHHTPQVGFAQIEPATSASPVNSTPISAEATAI